MLVSAVKVKLGSLRAYCLGIRPYRGGDLGEVDAWLTGGVGKADNLTALGGSEGSGSSTDSASVGVLGRTPLDPFVPSCTAVEGWIEASCCTIVGHSVEVNCMGRMFALTFDDE